MSLTTGTAGVKQKDYRVYIAETIAGVTSAVTAYENTPTKQTLVTLIAQLSELGEVRADSIDLTTDDGDSIEGNVSGKIVLNKASKFTVELINSTVDNIAFLEALDGKPCTVLMYEKDTHKTGNDTYKTAILIHNLVASYTEKITGKDTARGTITIERSVPTIGAFRSIHDINQA